MKHALLVLTFSVMAAVPPANAQLNANNARGFEPEKAYQIGEIDHVNLFNGNLIVTLPIGQRYRVSDHLSWGMTLVYNGNPWNLRADTADAEPIPSRFANAGLGWQLTLGELVGPNDTLATSIGANGQWVYAAPDGAERAFFKRLHSNEENTAYEAPETPAPGEVVGYTRDGTYLRLVRGGPRFVRPVTYREPNPNPPPPFITREFYIFVADYVIEFPDGTRHTLTSHEYANDQNVPPDFAFEKSARYRLTKIEDRFGNSVSVSSTDEGNASAPTATWTITERIGSTVLRTHTVNLGMDTFRQLGRTPQSRRRVDSVTLSAFGGQTVTYNFQYSGDTTISAPCNRIIDDPATTGNFLRGVNATQIVNGVTTTLLTYSMDHNEVIMEDDQVVCSDYAGHLKSITLPTGGSIEYTAKRRVFPSERTGADPSPGPDMFPNISTALATRTVVQADGTREKTDYNSRLHTPATYVDEGGTTKAADTQMTVIVTDPIGNVTHNHFFVAKIGNSNTCFAGANFREYGLPFLRISGTAEGDLLLSSEVYDNTCVTFESANGCRPACRNAARAFVNPLRRTYVKYEFDGLDFAYPRGPLNQRVSASRTEFTKSFCGSLRCYTETRMSGFDGLGHYRTETRSSNIPGTTARTTETHYNANTSAGTYVPAGGSDPDTYMIAPGSPWLPGLHDQVKTTEGIESIVEQPCFDRTTGALQRRRLLSKTSTTPTTTDNDLLTVFTTSAGNVTGEAYHGGDVVTLPQMADPCATSPGAAGYELTHAYEAGVRKSSHFILSETSSLKALDLTVDASTGLPSVSRDPANVATSYRYDVLGRLEEERPQGEAWTRYTYDLSARPASIAAETFASTVTIPDETTPRLAEHRFYYDGHGRLIQSRTRMPAGWSVMENSYDELGRHASVTVPVAASSGAYEDLAAAAKATTFAYDRFGRPLSITTPDGKSVETAYDGIKKADRTVEIDGTETTITETFDGHGRLTSVTERMWDAPTTTSSITTTSYGYDAGNRLTSVTTGDQTRTFEYDGRGFLLREQHPETGVYGYGVTYYGTLAGADVVPEYDARGQVTRRVVTTFGGRYDLKFQYDRAGRLTEVQDLDPATEMRRVIKSFTYAASNDTTVTPHDLRAGKVTEAIRNNYVPGLGTVEVKETYRYQSPGGRATQRDTVVTGNSSFAGANFLLTQSWNDFGKLETLTYPVTAAASVPRTITNTFTDGLLTSVAGYASISYQANGLVDTVTHGTGAVKEKWIADPSGMPRPLRVEARGASNNLLWQYGDYAYDGAGNLTAIGSRSFDYDGLNRLVGWRDQVSGGYMGVRRELDVYGNYLTSHYVGCRTTAGGRMECYTSGSLAYTISGTTNHYAHETYDDAGSVIADAAHTYAYDGAGSMTLLLGSGRNERFIYTADDERIAIIDLAANRTTWTLRDTGHRLLRTFTRASVSGNTGWSWTEDEIWRGALLLASESPTGRKQYHLDHLGSPRAVTNIGGTTLSEQTFQPFGEGGTSDGGRLQFTGHERDRIPAHGFGFGRVLDYMHARYYAPDSGRFLSLDPVLNLKRHLRKPLGWNKYSYVENNPLRFVDPTGKYTCRGWASECQAFEASLLILRAAAFELARRGEPGATGLIDIATLYGKLGQDNGVNVQFTRTKHGAMSTSMDPDTKVVTITVDRRSFASMTGYFQVALAQAHEGNHGVAMRADPAVATSRSRADKMRIENSAYRAQAYINSALGVDDVYWQLWTKTGGFDPFQITSWAAKSVALACSYEPCTP